MRSIIILRGAPGAGKSTFIKENNLEGYTISPDEIRLMCQSPIYMADGTTSISQANNKEVWEMVYNLMEIRMQHGEFIVVDATFSRTAEILTVKKYAQKYKYRVFCVDFTDLDIEECKRRNAGRLEYKRVPETVIERMYNNFKTNKVPSGIKVIKPEEFEKVYFKPIDLSRYNKIHHIGDIHGCYTALMTYLKNESDSTIKDDEFYIFTGDYIDRGIENDKVIEFLISIMDKPNVLLLEGNHEKWLNNYANNEISKSPEFETNTKKQLNDISKTEIRKLCRRISQCAYYTYYDKTFFVCHGGIPVIPLNLSFIATEQLIHGVGKYSDIEEISEVFLTNSAFDFVYQIHGHRNPNCLPIRVNDRMFNLEGKVEMGGDLRCVQVSRNDIKCVATKNTVFKRSEDTFNSSEISEVIKTLKENNYVREKKFDNISSFNFTRNAFYDGIWNDITTKARGLYIDTEREKIIARGFDKFFNINEREETTLNALKSTLKFPMTAYVKENGFLGLIGYDESKDDLLIASKSMIGGDFAGYLSELIYTKISPINRQKMMEYIKKNNVTFVFEVIDIKNDPHIIEYDENKLILLDIIQNDINFIKLPYEEMCEVAKEFSLEYKEKAYEIKSWEEFLSWYEMIQTQEYKYKEKHIEGFVLEDISGFMIKVKLPYYNFWKIMRTIVDEVRKRGESRKIHQVENSIAKQFYNWLLKLENMETSDIISLRKKFFEDKCN